MVLGLTEGLVECATVCIKIWVILRFLTSESFLSALQKVIFFSSGFKYFFMLAVIFLHPEELAPHAKNVEWGDWCLQIWSIIIHNWHFLEIFVQIPYARHYNPQFVYFLPQFSLRFIL